MAGWVFLCVLTLCMSTPSVIRARKAARKPPIASWVRVEPTPLADAEQPVAQDEVLWTDLDDRQLERLLSESST